MSSISNIASLPGSPIAGGQGPAIPMTRAAVPTSAPGDLRRAAIQDAHAFRAMPPAALRLHQAVRPPSDATAHAAAPDLAAAIATIVGAMGRQQHILHRCEAGALMWVPAPAAPAPKGPLGAHPLQRPVATAAERDALDALLALPNARPASARHGAPRSPASQVLGKRSRPQDDDAGRTGPAPRQAQLAAGGQARPQVRPTHRLPLRVAPQATAPRPAPQPVSARQPHGDLDVTAVIARLAQGVHQQVAIAVRHHAESGAHARAPLHDRQELNFFRARLQEVQQHHAAIVQRCASRGQVAQGARGPARAVPGIIAGPHGTQWAPRGQGLDVHTPAGVRHIALTTEPESVMFNRRRTMAYAKHRHANLATIIDLRSLRVVGLADIARSE